VAGGGGVVVPVEGERAGDQGVDLFAERVVSLRRMPTVAARRAFEVVVVAADADPVSA
jgi:hypothetical protein